MIYIYFEWKVNTTYHNVSKIFLEFKELFLDEEWHVQMGSSYIIGWCVIIHWRIVGKQHKCV